jgi:predicted nucleotidyltransferase
VKQFLPVARQIQGLRPALHSMGVAQLWLFGSAARGEADAQDVDVLVEFVSRPTLVGFMDLKFFLEERLGKPVDLHTKSSCPERFLRRIETEMLHVA